MIRRINKEIEIYNQLPYHDYPVYQIIQPLDENMLYLDCEIGDTIIVSFYVNISRLYKIILNFKKHVLYPFSPPYIFIYNNISYQSLYIFNPLLNQYIQKYNIKNMFVPCCICCHSIVESWRPSYTMKDILREIIDILSNHERLTRWILAKYIMKKHIGFIIPSLFSFI